MTSHAALSALAFSCLVLATPCRAADGPAAFTPEGLWDAWPSARVSPPEPYAFRHAALTATLEALGRDHPGLFSIVDEGRSAEGRRLAVLKLGTGPVKVLLWSQMHGDEPTATSAIVDLVSLLGRTRESDATGRLLSRLTIYLLPMLNPDGAERTTRRNAQGIDVNRDALRLQTPEGRYLKSVRDRLEPSTGYNLHNQSPLTVAGPGGSQVALSLLSVAFDEALTEDAGRRRTKRLALAVVDAVAPWAKGKVARYDADYAPRAFGDSMTRWGTATLLIETGGWNGPDEPGTLVRLNFVALLMSLQALADGSLEGRDPKGYDALPVVRRDGLFDLVVREAAVLNGGGFPPYVADVALNRAILFGGLGPRSRAGVADLGDLSTFRGKDEIDARGKLLVPAPAGGEEGWARTFAALKARGLADDTGTLQLPAADLSREVKAWMPAGALLVPGYSGDLLLLEPSGAGWKAARRLPAASR
jgi:hypothetical protein